MKINYLLLAWLLLSVQVARAQNESLNHFMEAHKRDQGFTFAYLSKDLFEVVSRSQVEAKDWKKLQQLVKNIGSLRILAADDIPHGLLLYQEVLDQVPTEEFDELLIVRAEQTKVRIWAKSDGSGVTDLILLVGSPEEFALVCFAGALELGNITDLARLFDASAAEDLVSAAKAAAVDFQISPNPSNGVFTLTYDDEQDGPTLLSIADQNGRQLSTLRLSGTATQQVALQDLPAGLYWLQLKTGQGKIGIKQLQILKN